MKIKKLLFLLIILLFANACTLLPVKKERMLPNEEKIKIYIDNWELKKLEDSLDVLKENYASNKRYLYYKKELSSKKILLENLNNIIKEIKKEIKANNEEQIEKYIDKSIINRLKFNELKSLDFSNCNIFSGKIKLSLKKAELLILINYMDNTFYYDIDFMIKKGQWKITSMNERR